MNINKIKHFYKNKYILTPIHHQKYFLCYNYKYKALWFRVAKVGSRTIDSYFRRNTPDDQYIYSSPTAYNPNDFAGYFKFAFVRDPLKRFLSAWKNKVLESNYFQFSAQEHQKMQNLDNFIEWVSGFDLRHCDEHLRLQVSLIDINNVDFLGRMNNFESDLRKVCNIIGMPIEEVVKKNQTQKQDVELTNNQIYKIKNLYSIDYQVFFYNQY